MQNRKITEFQTVLKKNRAKIKYNPLYTLLTEFSLEISKILPPSFIKKMNSCNAYLIQLDKYDSEIINLFIQDDFFLHTRHLRIDEAYTNLQNGCTPVHYTEIYFNKDMNSKIVVHAYFNSLGQHLYIEAKIINLTNNQENKLEISPLQKQAIFNNLKPASSIIKTLLEVKNKLYKSELEKSYTLDAELANLCRAISTPAGWQNYINKANEFIICINKINSLNENSIDIRAKAVRNLIKQFLTNRDNSGFTNQLVNNDDSASEEEKVTILEKVLVSKVIREVDLNKQFILLKEQATAYIKKVTSIINSKDIIKGCINLDNLIFEMQLNLLEVCNFEVKQYPRKTNIINNLEKAIKQAKEWIQISMLMSMKDGDQATLEAIFDLGHNYLDNIIYFEFIKDLVFMPAISKRDLDKINKLFKICDFLYINSDVFKNSIYMASLVHVNINENLLGRIFLRCYSNNNFLVFKKLIEYGGKCDIGLYNSKYHQCIPLLNSIVYMDAVLEKNDFSYIDLLLSQNIDHISGRKLSRNSVAMTIDLKNNIINNNDLASRQRVELDIKLDSIFDLTPLEIATKNPKQTNYTLVEKLVPYADLLTLALNLSHFANLNCIRTICMPTNTANGVFLCSSEAAKYETVNTINTFNKNTNKLVYLMHISKEMPEGFVKSVRLICDKFKEEFSQLSNPATINHIIKQFLSDINSLKITRDTIQYRCVQYNACLFLLALKNELDLNDSLLAVSLFKNLIILYKQFAPQQLQTEYNRLNNFILLNQFKLQLEKSQSANTLQAIETSANILNQTIMQNKNKCLLNMAFAAKCNKATLLLEYIALPNFEILDINNRVPGSTAQTILHYACSGNSYECAKILILLGASMHHKDKNDQTPLDLLSSVDIKSALVELYTEYAKMLENESFSIELSLKLLCFPKAYLEIDKFLPFIRRIENKYFGESEIEAAQHIVKLKLHN